MDYKTIIKKIKNINSANSTVVNQEVMIINHILINGGSEKNQNQIEKLILKGKTTYKKILNQIEKSTKIENRTKHCFNTLNELNEFTKNNNCGDMWDENNQWCVYKY